MRREKREWVMDVSVLRLFAPFLMAALSTCSVSAESKIMPRAQGLWERNWEGKKKKSFQRRISLGHSAGNIAATSGWPRPHSASQTPVRIIFGQERIRNKIISHFLSVKTEERQRSLYGPTRFINHALIWHIVVLHNLKEPHRWIISHWFILIRSDNYQWNSFLFFSKVRIQKKLRCVLSLTRHELTRQNILIRY